MVACETIDGLIFATGSRHNPRTGEFTVSGVPTGTCKLVARSEQHGGPALYAEQLVSVANSDVSGIQLTLQPLPEVAVVIPGHTGPLPFEVQLIPVDQSNGFPGQMRAQWFANGDTGYTAIRNIRPGTFRVSAQANGNSCIGTMQAGGRDLTREPLVIAAETQPQPIQITLRTDCGTLIGTVEGAQPNSPVWVILVGGPGEATARYASNASFNFANLTPGDYDLYAFDNASELEYANPEVMKRFEGQRVTITPGGKATVQLKLQNATGGTQ
jgi:hypothetical protein